MWIRPWSIVLGFAMLALMAAPLHAEDGVCSPTLWYNGDGDPRSFNSGFFTNMVSDYYGFASIVFEDFEVTSAGGWTVTSAWSNNFTNARHVIAEAEWQIRRDVVVGDVSDGGGGEWVAGGRAPAVQVVRMPSCIDGDSHGVEVTVLVTGLNVELPPGRYHVGVAPVLYENDQSIPTDTLGGAINAVESGGLADNAFALRSNPDYQFYDDQPSNSEVFVRADYGSQDGAPNYSVGVGGYPTGSEADPDSCLSTETRCLGELSDCTVSFGDLDALLTTCETDRDACTVTAGVCAEALGACDAAEAACVSREATCLGGLDTVRAELETCDAATTALASQVDALVVEQETRGAQVVALEADVARVEAQRDELLAERGALEQRVFDLEGAISALRLDRDALADSLAEALASEQTLVDERSELVAALEIAEGEAAAASEELEALQARHDMLTDTVAAMTVELDASRELIEDLGMENAGLSDTLDLERAQHAETRGTLETQARELSSLAEEFTMVEAANVELTARLAAVERERDAAEGLAFEMETQGHRLAAEVTKLRTSLESALKDSKRLDASLKDCEETAVRDADADGNADSGDRCPKTSAETPVDGQGCSHSQRCALQTDASSCRLTWWDGGRQSCRWKVMALRRFACVPAD